jgi:uncharacterized SAM-binding protein YcdF (DUF218 family)
MKKLIRLLFFLGLSAVVVFLLWIFHDPVLALLGEILVARDRPAPSAFIVVLSGESPARTLHGWELYKQGLAPMILMTQARRSPAELELERRGMHYPEFSELDRKMLVELGVPEKNIVVLPARADSTFSEAVLTRSFFGKQPPPRLLLVTSRYHSRRARMTFRHVFGDSTEILSAPTPFDDFDPDHWWENRAGIRNLLVEYQKGLFYVGLLLWDRFHSWKTAPATPAAIPN